MRAAWPVLLFPLAAPSCASVTSPQPPTARQQIAFDRYEVVTDSAERQSVLTGFLLGGRIAELAVVSVAGDDRPRLRVYALADSTWVPGLDVALRHGVRFVDVANIGGRDRLLSYEPGRLNWFDPELGNRTRTGGGHIRLPSAARA